MSLQSPESSLCDLRCVHNDGNSLLFHLETSVMELMKSSFKLPYTTMSAKVPQATMTLKQFMLRQQVLKLYRSFLRTVREVPNEESKKELLEWIHSDFKNNKHHTDEYAIKMLLHHGERQLKQLQQNVAFSR